MAELTDRERLTPFYTPQLLLIDGCLIGFCRCATGASPALGVINCDGSDQRMLIRGLDEKEADHPRWFPEDT